MLFHTDLQELPEKYEEIHSRYTADCLPALGNSDRLRSALLTTNRAFRQEAGFSGEDGQKWLEGKAKMKMNREKIEGGG
ncbi:uncharacterized [Tachysurus ichikawai]